MRYHVFLSFRGPDTRRTFTDHLYAALVRKGVVTFKDDQEIEKGEAVRKKLIKAIQQSRYFIIVISQQFASSAWCLDELQQIVETKQKDSVFPVFYEVEPRDIGRALANLRRQYSRSKTSRWSQVLSKVAKFSGWIKKNTRGEATLVEEIATHIWNKLCDQLPSNFEYLVGDMQSKAERVISHLGIGLDDTRFIGIWGMGGAGKTTLGRVVYDAVKKNFENSCFLSDIRKDSEKFGLVHLQKKLLSNLNLGKPKNIKDSFHGSEIIRTFLYDKKVLIVFDDVSHRNQLDNLARNKKWFGAGSKIIITTRDKHLLTQYEHFYDYKVDMLSQEESLKLLCQKAFKRDQPEEVFSKVSDEVVGYAGGHPMALEVLGTFLCRREKYEWRCTIDMLRQNIHKEILSQLRISYDELEERYKAIFLDIACFFNKESEFKVENMLKSWGLDETIGIKVLTEKSLLSQTARDQCQSMRDRLQKTSKNTSENTGKAELLQHEALKEEASKEYLYMHDLLQEMGRNIVIQESPIDARRRSRLWSFDDIDLVVKENKGTKYVRSIVLKTQEDFTANWDPNCFSKMINLRLLDLGKVHLLRKLESLPTSLKFLRWDDYAWHFLPSIEKLCNLESIQLCNSKIRTLWEGNPSLHKLKIIDMSGSESLSETPDFSKTPNLEELLLNYCINLTTVHDSVGLLKKLVKLSLKGCVELQSVPTQLETENLREFILMGCSGLEELPNFSEGMKSLYFLDVSNTAISQIPRSIKFLTNLLILNLSNCRGLNSLPLHDLPPRLIVCGSNIPQLNRTIAQLNLSPSRPKRLADLQGPFHSFGGLREGATILEWFEQRDYCWGKDMSGEFVTITAEGIPPANVADSNEECWGIAVCLFLKTFSQASQSYIDWSFNQRNANNKTKMYTSLSPDDDDWGYYVGFFPFVKEQCRLHTTPNGGEAYKLDFTISFLTTNADGDLLDLAIKGCQWRLASTLDFDNRETGESSNSVAERIADPIRHRFLPIRFKKPKATVRWAALARRGKQIKSGGIWLEATGVKATIVRQKQRETRAPTFTRTLSSPSFSISAVLPIRSEKIGTENQNLETFKFHEHPSSSSSRWRHHQPLTPRRCEHQRWGCNNHNRKV